MWEKVTTSVNFGLKITEYENGIRFGTDALLVSDFCPKSGKYLDLGCGSGAISLLLLAMGKAKTVCGVELVPEYAELSAVNAVSNGFGERFCCRNADVLDIKSVVSSGEMDAVVTNPPYLKIDSGFLNEQSPKHTAFHETTADINGFVSAAAYALKFGGIFCAVYRPEYMARLISAMETNNLKLKKLKLVYPSFGKPPCLVLVSAKKNGNDGCEIMNPLYIYSDTSHKQFTPEMARIINT